MITASTNLASRPFRNERLPWLMSGLLLGAALVTSCVHGRFVSELLSRDEASTVRTVREDEARIAELEALLSSEPPIRIAAAERTRLQTFKDLVDRRVFPWRRLLSEMEAILSDDVRLTRIAPSTGRDEGVQIELTGEARTKDAAFTLAETLDASPVFSSAALKSMIERDGRVDFTIEVIFDPAQGPELAATGSFTPAKAALP